MKASWLAVVGLALGLPAYAVSAGAQDRPQAKFRSSVEVVSVSAVVKDRKGRFVPKLQQRDFVVLESGKERNLIDFRAETDGPVKLGLLIDASGSMRVGQKAVDAYATARQVFSALRPGDHAAVFSFDTRVDRVLDFTSDVAALESSLDRLNPPFGQTSLYDAINQAARLVAGAVRSAGNLPQRSALVVITDGIDTRSKNTTEQVAAAASRMDVPVYIIAVTAPIDDPRVDDQPPFSPGDLSTLARGTGGDMFVASAPAHASVVARQIVSELRHQYVLAFAASPQAGWRPVEVRARNGKYVVRARTGYVAGDSGRSAPGDPPRASFNQHAATPAAACGTL